jgi:hypothetical protein
MAINDTYVQSFACTLIIANTALHSTSSSDGEEVFLPQPPKESCDSQFQDDPSSIHDRMGCDLRDHLARWSSLSHCWKLQRLRWVIMKTLKKDDRSQGTSNYNLIYRMSRISQGTLNPLNFLCKCLHLSMLSCPRKAAWKGYGPRVWSWADAPSEGDDLLLNFILCAHYPLCIAVTSWGYEHALTPVQGYKFHKDI